MAALAVGTVDVTSLIADRFPIERGVEAMRRAGQPGVLKVLLDVNR